MRKECITWPFEMLFIIGLIWNKLGLLKDDDTDYLCLSSIWFKGWFSLYNSTILKHWVILASFYLRNLFCCVQKIVGIQT